MMLRSWMARHFFYPVQDALCGRDSLGYWRKLRRPFEKSSEPIRWDALANRSGTEVFLDMLALSQTDDVTLLAEDRFEERILVFEEYANGGLEVLQELVDSSPKRVVDIVRDLIRSADAEAGAAPEPLDITAVVLD